MKWTRYGPNALLLRFSDQVGEEAFEIGRTIVKALELHPPAGLTEYVVAFTSVLLEFDRVLVPDPTLIAPELIARLASATRSSLPPSPIKELPIIYDGPDLTRVAEHNQLRVKEVCEWYAATIYKVYMLGFSPGFPYMGDLNPRLHTPRLASPRPRVSANSVAIGGEHTGIYTVDSPGGWNIIGHTPHKLFDPSRVRNGEEADSIFLLKPGDRVRFVPISTGKGAMPA